MKGFRAFGQAAWRRGNRWAIKGCSGEGTRGLKVQIQAISECIRTNPQACSMAPSLSVLSIYTCGAHRSAFAIAASFFSQSTNRCFLKLYNTRRPHSPGFLSLRQLFNSSPARLTEV